jgi:glucose uptake protein
MILVQNYTLAVLLCALAMICWGSWQNTQNLIGKGWRFELFYWDYSIGIVLFALLMAFTFGSLGSQGRIFCPTWRRQMPGISSHLLSEDLSGM